jgi:K+-transporting ATPase KdpA subunit
MQVQDYGLILAFFVLVLVPAPFIGRFIHRAMEGQRTFLTPLFAPVERFCYRIAGVDPHSEQDWKTYTVALLLFNAAGLALLFAILMLQGMLPLNPQKLPGLEWTLAFNTAVSFVTNTNWQAYSGEASLSYFSQMVGLGVQNFVSAAVGLCVLVALARGISRRSTDKLGNFWVDLTRGTLYALLPLCLLLALFLVWQGVPQTFLDYVSVHTLAGTDQVVPLGPAASQIAIKQLGTNGGGFFGVNSAHPFENPSAWSNLLEMASIILIPAALVFTFGSAPEPRAAGDHADPVRHRPGRDPVQRVPAQPGPGRSAHRAVRFPGGQGEPPRHHRLGTLGGDHHGCVQRLGELDARQLQRHRRDDPDVQHDARRGDLRRRRRGPLRHAAVRADRRVPRRPDDRPHP